MILCILVAACMVHKANGDVNAVTGFETAVPVQGDPDSKPRVKNRSKAVGGDRI